MPLSDLDSGCRAGIHLPTVEVRFSGITVDAEVYKGDRALPTLTNSYRNLIEVTLESSSKSQYPDVHVGQRLNSLQAHAYAATRGSQHGPCL